MYRTRTARLVASILVAAAVGILALVAPQPAAGEENSLATAAEHRLVEAARYLASDELEGRGVGTKGLDLAADYIARRFAELGLDTSSYGGTPFQTFTMTIGAELGEPNHLALTGPPGAERSESRRIELELAKDMMPLAMGSSGSLDLPLVFAGYGITAKDEGYDDYAGLDVKGKAVVVLRHEPQQADPHSVFNGTDNSPHAPLARKVSNAYEHGAAAVLFCTDEFEIREKVRQRRKQWQAALDELAAASAKVAEAEDPTLDEIEAARVQIAGLLDQVRQQGEKLQAEYDPVLDFRAGGQGDNSSHIPVVHCRRGVLDKVLQSALATTLSELERRIDEGLQPSSGPLEGWRLAGEVTIERQQAEVKNVVASLAGEGPLAQETIVVGAHYDHLGWGGEGSLAPGVQEIHNGADDNGSGVAVLLEVAQALVGRQEKLPRRVVFIAFTGEERGLIGSSRYTGDPLAPLDNTVAMLNMDMVGRLDEDKLIIQGVDTAVEFDAIVGALDDQYGFKVTRQPGGFGPSDHSAFYAHKVPVMHFFTGTHADYHRPSDDYDKLNVQGMRRVAEMVTQIVVDVAQLPERPQYRESQRPAQAGRSGDRPYFGSIPDFASEGPGYAVSGAAQGSPAQKAGLEAGDVILRFGESKIGGLEDFDSALRKHKAGDKVPLVVQRDGQELTLEVVLEDPR